MTAFLSPDESERIDALNRYQIVDTSPEPAFDRLTSLAARLLQAPMSAIAFVNTDRVWIKSGHGFQLREMGRETSFSNYAILQDEVLALSDAREDPRFAASEWVTGPTAVRASACAPLKTPEGFRVGSLCVLDRAARKFPPEELRLLEELAAMVMDELELRRECREAMRAVRRQPERQDLWAVALNSAALGVTIVDEEGWFVDVNPAYCRMLGYAREELVGRHFTLALPPDAHSVARRAHTVFFETGDRSPIGWELRRKDGTRIDVQITGAAFTCDDGRRFRVTTVTDVTALKQLDDHFRETEKMAAVSRLAGGAAHGFNNLLTIVSGYSQLLKAGIIAGDPLGMYVEEIARASERAAELTSKLLAFSRRRFGEPKRLDINRLIEEEMPNIREELPSEIELEADLESGVAAVFGDQSYFLQAIRDLITNSREAMPRGGRITIRTANFELEEDNPEMDLRRGLYALVTVEDTGEGIDPQMLKHIFEPFYTTKGVGRGTGLATTYGTIRQWGGQVTVVSTPGKGTTVSLYIPAIG